MDPVLAAHLAEINELEDALIRDDDKGRNGFGMVFWMGGRMLFGEGRRVEL
jgi:hypothetical protein